jgi:hypothetical protein
VLVFVVAALQAPMLAQSGQTRPTQADPIVRLLADLEAALDTGGLPAMQALAPRGLSPEDLARASAVFARGKIADAAVRERFRRPAEGSFEVLAEVFVSYGREGRVATWQITAEPSRQTPDRVDLVSFREVAAIDGLLRLVLDRTRQYSVRDFTLEAPDMALKMSSGSAFVAESPSGITALVLIGDGEMKFSPPDLAEQGQVRLLSGEPTLESRIESAYVRMSPVEFQSRTGSDTLVETRVDPGQLRRAQEIFDLLSPRTFNLDLPGLTTERWSLEPTLGSIVVEFRARRFGWLTYALSPNDNEDISVFDRARGRNISVYASAAKLAQRGRFYSDDDSAAYDVEHYGLDLTFDPERSWISGRATLRLRIRSRLVGTLTMRLAAPLAVSSVSTADLGQLMALRVAGQSSVLVSLPAPLERGSVLTLEIAYSGRLDPQPLDREAIAPQGVTPPQDPREEGARILPEARYLYSNRSAWYPQAPVSDYASARMRLSVPSEFQMVASGTPVNVVLTRPESSRASDARPMRITEYVADRPVRYLACLISRFVPVAKSRVETPAIAPAIPLPPVQSANPFDTPIAAPTGAIDRDGRSIGLEIVSTPRMAGSNRQLVPRLSEMLTFYSKIMGEAPYPDFTLAAIDDNLPGGHSPAYFALLHQPLPTTAYSWSSDPVAFEVTYQHFFLAHEVAHQWWGQAIGWKNYHEQWLSEGLSQYFALLYAGEDRGPDVLRSLIGQMRGSALGFARQGPISLGYRLGHIQGEGRIFRGLLYNKSAVVLHMLRGLIGDEAFFGGLRTFYRDWRFKKAGTNDLRLAFESASRRSLERFFERWVYSGGIPRLRARHMVDATGTPVLRVEQIGDVYDVPVIFTVQYADGTSEDVLVSADAAVVDHKLSKSVRRVNVREELTLAEFVR